MKHQKTVCTEPVLLDGIPVPTLEQVREAVEMAWADAANLPDVIEHREVCRHLGAAAECLDAMIERAARKKTRRPP